jgi:transposase InsO family protein
VERKLVDVCREHDLKQSEVEEWMETFVKTGERGLKARAEDEQAAHEAEVRELRAKIGELVLELDARKKLAALSEKAEIDATHVFCGQDGWCHLTALLDCCDRPIVGWRLSRWGVARIAAAPLEDALRDRRIEYGPAPLTLRSDNGLGFGAKVFVSVVRRDGLDQEYITPYSPEQNGMIERFFSDADGGVPLASPVHQPRRGFRRDRGLAREVP